MSTSIKQHLSGTPYQGSTTYSLISSDEVSGLRETIRKPDDRAVTNSSSYQVFGENFCKENGIFFQTTEKLDDAYLSPANWALLQFKEALEKFSKLPIQEILTQCDAYGIGYILERYFEKVDHPEEQDLIIYRLTKKLSLPKRIQLDPGIKHVGIYRNPTVESKWELTENPLVFQHEVFFIPNSHGNLASFYHLRKSAPLTQPLPKAPPFEMAKQQDDCFTYIDTPEHQQVRDIIDKTTGVFLEQEIPQIRVLKEINFMGTCYRYAFGKVLQTYEYPSGLPHLMRNQTILDRFFTRTTEPKPEDLVAYYAHYDSPPGHYGIYLSDNFIESKWGCEYVYIHPPFFVPKRYGQKIVYYQIRSDLTPQTLLESLRQYKTRREC